MKLIFILVFCHSISAQTVISEEFYQGTINNDYKISLYLKTEETGCPSTIVSGIYKYDNNKTNNWILLDVIFSEENKRFTLVEHYNTGVLLLKKNGESFNGYWISPDGEKKIKVMLKKVKVSKSKIIELNDKLEYENYIANDC